MEQPKSTAGTTPDLAMARGLEGANYNRAPGGGRKMFLTSPYIGQAVTLKPSAQAAMSAMGFFTN
jgi:hypothetical protein